ncbi:XrtA/PEP-CTERM system-associated ATPase [Novosphingobium album (ex Liu et al. 2023)]|uniref:XrtA-associated ATPase n=1 Tax=Novosphingobium album (ex Liu et al. 2023) TaxID=3031130 RepID=A0ABT5WUF5_9SPHN|nr:XrtA/PEP-CTERM system-associated ATPase [Novosphingobium album (ex Liu et al. 2023)]MDE8653536.1 XrtA-associated ATPase [Novosphingobium album (ex Liu et al. 2023)]
MFDDFYGLDARPFQLTPDPAFYFESLTHRKALSYLGYGLAQGEGFVVITGEVGAGKSTLVAHLMAMIDPSRLTAAQIVTSKLDGEEIVHVVAQAFGLMIEGHDKASALGAIESFLHDEARAGRRCLLIVDESQNLSIAALEELRMLSNFQLGSHPLLQTLLLGQPEFRDLLLEHPDLEQLRQRVIATHHLTAMEPKEVQPYIEHRMKCVGWSGNPAFDQRVFAEIYDATGGIPRRINQIVNRLLLLGAVEQRTRIDAAMLHSVLAELHDDGAIAIVSPRPQPAEPAEPVAAADAVEAAPEPVAAIPATQPPAASAEALLRLEASLAERDAQIVELQQAVVELANAAEDREEQAEAAHAGQVEQLNTRIAALEAQLAEQDRTIRHTLTMLIEFIESGEGQREAA